MQIVWVLFALIVKYPQLIILLPPQYTGNEWFVLWCIENHLETLNSKIPFHK